MTAALVWYLVRAGVLLSCVQCTEWVARLRRAISAASIFDSTPFVYIWKWTPDWKTQLPDVVLHVLHTSTYANRQTGGPGERSVFGLIVSIIFFGFSARC